MNSDTTPKAKKFFKYKFSPWIIGVGVVYLFIEFFWKFPFIWGTFFGIYWLFVFVDATAPQLTGIALGLSIVLLLVFVAMAIIKKGNQHIVGELAIAFLICGIILASTVFSWFPQHTIHVDSTRIENRVYHLAVYPMFDLNYRLYQCDIAGVFCKRVFRSGDISSRIDAKLEYDIEKHTLSIISKEVGEIYVYELP